MVGKLSVGRLSVNKPSVNKTILILNAGGTIGMVAGRSGLVPSRRFTRQIEEWLGRRDELNCNHYVIDAVEPLIDSANAEPSTWHGIARPSRRNPGKPVRSRLVS
jgi:L-asparaginase/Glu-tRNA(Gln) amidotransferase subunit D